METVCVDSTYSEDEFLCVNLAAPNRHSYGSYLSQTSSNFSTQLKTQSVKTCSEQQHEANGVDHNYEYIDITAQQVWIRFEQVLLIAGRS